MSVEISVLPKRDAHELVKLFDVVWGEGQHHSAHARWALQSNPVGNGPIVIARDGNMLVASRASIRWPFQAANGYRPIVYQLTGTCVHPDYRRRGLFSEVNRYFLDMIASPIDRPTVFNISVEASRKGYEKLGWNYIPGLRRNIRIARPKSFFSKILRSPRNLRAETQLIPTKLKHSLTPFEKLIELARRREELLKTRHHTYYDAEVYEWRYSKDEHIYRDVFISGVGWCVYKVFQRGNLVEAEIGDIWLNKNSPLAMRALLAKIVSRDLPDIFTVVISRGHPLRKHLWVNGFAPDPKGDLNFGVRLVDERSSNLEQLRTWAIMTETLDTF